MKTFKRRLYIGAIAILSLLAGIVLPVSVTSSSMLLSTSSPDLIINEITLSPEEPGIGDTVSFKVVVKNQGDTLATASHVACYVDGTFLGSAYVPAISPNYSTAIYFTWKAVAGEEHY